MSWPSDDLTNAHTNAGTDDPTQARDEINSAILKVKAILAAVSSAATASFVVLRDASGDFAANFITAVKIIGDVAASNGTIVLDSGSDGTDATFTGNVTGDLLGTPSAPTPTAGDDSTRVATTEYVQGEVVSSSVPTTTVDVTVPVAFVAFTDLAGSRRLKLSLSGVTSSLAAGLAVQVSTDNGLTWVVTNSYFTTVADNNTSTTLTTLSIITNNSLQAVAGVVELFDLGVVARLFLDSRTGRRASSSNYTGEHLEGGMEDALAYNALRVIPTLGGTIDSGRLVLEEIE